MLLLIPLLPFLGFLLNAGVGRRLAKPVSGGVACAAMLASFAVSAMAVLRLVAVAARIARDRPAPVHLDHLRRIHRCRSRCASIRCRPS